MKRKVKKRAQRLLTLVLAACFMLAPTDRSYAGSKWGQFYHKYIL